MDPFSAQILAGLAVEAVVGIAGPIGRHFGKGKVKLSAKLQAALEGEAQRALLKAVGDLSAQEFDEHSIDRALNFLRSPEGAGVFRGVLISILSGDASNHVRDFEDQSAACLEALHNFSREGSARIARILIQVVSRTCQATRDRIANDAPEVMPQIVSMVQAERATGYLQRIVAQAERIRSFSPAQVAALLEAAHKYRDELGKHSRDMPTSGHRDDPPVPLDDFYVSPDFHTREARRYAKLGAADQEFDTLDLEQLRRRIHRTVVLGSPGAGKTTLTKKLTLDAIASGPPEASPLTEWFPFHVVLRDFEKARTRESLNLLDYISRWIHSELHIELSPKEIEFICASGRAFFLLDGLDELTDVANRQSMVALVSTFARLYPDCSLLVTCRQVGYDEAPLDANVFSKVWLSDFSDEAVGKFVSNWYGLSQRLSPTERIDLPVQFLAQSETVKDLRANPLMLGLMCRVFHETRSIPENRAELYEDCAVLLFQRWDQRRGIVSGGTLRRDARLALQEIAYWVLTTQDSTTGIKRSSLEKRLTRFWRQRFETNQEARREATDLLNLWSERAWVLTDVSAPSGETLYDFTHRTFMEYFAALHLSRICGTPKALWAALRPRVEAGEWDIVAQLAIQTKDRDFEGASSKIYRQAMDAALESRIRQRLNILTFLSRNVLALLPSPKTCRRLARVALEVAPLSQQQVDHIPTYDRYTSNYHGSAKDILELLGRPDASSVRQAIVQQVGEALEIGEDDIQLDDVTFDDSNDTDAVPLDYLVVDAVALIAPLLNMLNAAEKLPYVLEELKAHAQLLLASESSVDARTFILISNITMFCDLAAARDLRDYVTSGEGRPSESVLSSWIPRNFMAAYAATRSGLLALSVVIEAYGFQVLFCVGREAEGASMATESKSYGEEILVRLLGDVHTSDDLDVLKLVSNLETPNSQVDQEWLYASGAHVGFIRQKLDSEFSAVDKRYENLRDLGHDEEDEISYPSWPAHITFGAWRLLAVLAEADLAWSPYDYSEDQLVSIKLGPLSFLSNLLVCRRLAEDDRPMTGLLIEPHLDGVAFSSAAKAEMLDWQATRISFIAT